MSDETPRRGVDASRLKKKVAGVAAEANTTNKLSGLDLAQKHVLLTMETLDSSLAKGAGQAVSQASSILAQMNKLAMRESFVAGSAIDAATTSIEAIHRAALREIVSHNPVAAVAKYIVDMEQDRTREIASLVQARIAALAHKDLLAESLAGMRAYFDQGVASRSTIEEAMAGLRAFVNQGVAAQAALGINSQSLYQRLTESLAVLGESRDDWLAYVSPSDSFFPARQESREWIDDEEEGVYEVELTDSGLYTVKRGRGRPVGSTNVKQDQYVQVLHLYLDRYHSTPSIKQLAGAIADVLDIPVSMDTVKRYAILWFGSWLEVRKYCWRLLKGKG